MGSTSSTNIFDTRPNEKKPRYQREAREVDKTEGRSRKDLKILMLEVLHARHVC